MKGLRCAHRGASQPRGWNPTTGPSRQTVLAKESKASGSLARETQSSLPVALAMILSQGKNRKILLPSLPPLAPQSILLFVTISLGSHTLLFLGWASQLKPSKAPPARLLCLEGSIPGPSQVMLGTLTLLMANASRNQDKMYFYAAFSDFQGLVS